MKYLLICLCFFVMLLSSYFTSTHIISNAYATMNEKLNFETFETEKVASVEEKEIKKWHNKSPKYVYLTFDDGPSKNTAEILDILNDYDAPSTFFLLGNNIKSNSKSEELLNSILDQGHYIGLHSMTHQNKKLYTHANAAQNFVDEMLQVQDLVFDYTDGFETSLIRAPYGATPGKFSEQHIKKTVDAGLKLWDWNVDSVDWNSDAKEVIHNVKKYTKQNADKEHLIVLFHEKDSTVEALPTVIEYYQSLGYEIVPYNPNQHVVMNYVKSDDL